MPQAQYMQLLEHNAPTVRQWLDSLGYEHASEGNTLSVEVEGAFVEVPQGKFICLRPERREIWVADEAPPIEEENQQVTEVSGQS